MTIESKGSIGIPAQKRQSLQAFWDSHDEMLQNELAIACDDAGLPDGIRDEVISNGMARFVLDQEGNLKPVSVYKTINELIEKCKKDNHKMMKTVKDFADERAVKKQQLKELMIHYANEGNSKQYRAVRKEYAML